MTPTLLLTIYLIGVALCYVGYGIAVSIDPDGWELIGFFIIVIFLWPIALPIAALIGVGILITRIFRYIYHV